MEPGENIRNFGLIAHIDAGKTTTTERLLYITGANYRIGDVDDGTTTTDWMLEEKERGITITAAAVSCNWSGTDLHIIDTPGHVDFIAEVHRSLRVLDGVVVVFCGVSGVQTQSEAVWKEADKFHVPRIAYINKLDRTGADFKNAVEEIEHKLKARTAPVSIPYYEDDNLKGIIDIINMKLLYFLDDGKTGDITDIPAAYGEIAAAYHDNLINVLTENNDHLLELALEGKVTPDYIIKAIRKGTIERHFVPVLAGSSYKNIGIPCLVDAIVAYLPSPAEIPQVHGYNLKKESEEVINFSKEAPPLVYIFKMQYNKEKGPLAFSRVYRGTITPGMTLYNRFSDADERIQDILKVYGDKYERMDEAAAGDIVILVGLKKSTTGETLGEKKNQVVLEKLDFPEPVLFVKVEPKNSIDMDKFVTARENLLSEDPTITYKEDVETGQTLIGGMGELHIEVFLDRIRSEYKVDINSGNPQVAHRETPLGPGEMTYQFESKIGGSTNHVTITLAVFPRNRNSGVAVSIDPSAKIKDKLLIESLKTGINNALISGPEGAYPVIDCEFIIKSISFDNDKNHLLAVEAASSICTTNLLRKTGDILLEPIMRLEIDIPENFTGGVIGDLQSRNGIVMDVEKKHRNDLIHARAPLKQLFGYATSLRSLTQGKGHFTMKFYEFNTAG